MTAVHGESVDVTTPDGAADAYLVHPDDNAPHPGVVLYMDAFGLRPSLRKLADDIAAHGYTVLVPNVFYRHGRAPVVELPDFIDPSQRPELFGQIMPMIQALTPDLIERDAGAYLAWLAGSPVVADGPVGTTGYCFGTRLALRTAAAYPDRVAAVGGFHGGTLAVDDPNSPHLLAGSIRAELYFGHADNDASLPPEQIERFEKALTEAGLTHRAEVYEGAAHGYTQADTAMYNAEADQRHRRELLALFDRTLRPSVA
ncbi:dienelactone hydrolase family protein [Nocardia terpenica]|uniref:Dienelactone hydrolase family protein n=1 Tax=Nocardia terpenica TaxID=455432 RepID=A0A6G9YY60_9NOCA|nr:dienelactone hydrolase family protein [Nocardia terpenica]QIS18067.1 dienelactone hydrolase family protein [Nocardia terpenica]